MLTAEQLASYRDNGYVLVRGALTPEEAAGWRQECHALIERLARVQHVNAAWGSARRVAPGLADVQVLHCHDVQFHSAAFSRLLLHPNITGPASQIIGPNVQLHHTKVFIKPPEKGAPFPMHQDYPYFPHQNHSMIAAIVHFDDAPVEKGCVRVVPGSHKVGPIQHSREGGWHLPLDRYPVESATPVPARAGDVLFFSYLTIHGSGVNTSNEARTTILIQMRDPADPPLVRVHESRGQGMMLAGIDPSCCKTRPLREATEFSEADLEQVIARGA